jgi:hypothetical protein
VAEFTRPRSVGRRGRQLIRGGGGRERERGERSMRERKDKIGVYVKVERGRATSHFYRRSPSAL